MRAAYGSVIAEARRILAEEGVLPTWRLADVRGASGSGHALQRLVAQGKAVQVRGSTLYARPDVAARIEELLAGLSKDVAA
jgi:hypothetical protein